MRLGRRIPTSAVTRQCAAPKLPGLIHGASPSISWLTVFLKAYAIVADRRPEMRRTWMPFPRPHLYEHPYGIGRVAIHREHRGVRWPLFAGISRPASRSLRELQNEIDWLQTAPLRDIPAFRSQYAFSAYPGVVRRMSLWASLNLSGERRCRRYGTFAMTTLAQTGAVRTHPATLGPVTLTYGPVSDVGEVTLSLVVDCRIHDDTAAGRCLQEIEQTLNGEIAEELVAIPASHDRYRALLMNADAERRRRAA
ncbi:MAG: hypothetical protein ACE5KM_06695 [Planctomycetaceae bacterium]